MTKPHPDDVAAVMAANKQRLLAVIEAIKPAVASYLRERGERPNSIGEAA
jgi:hypothetical protein